MRKIVKKIAFPFLNRWYQAKTKRTSSYTKYGLKISVLPGVFHPGIFLSTNLFINYLQTQSLANKSFLELGAGSGLISLFASKSGANVTATDINEMALKSLQINATQNALALNVIPSNLFENVSPDAFEMIVINPPYYPKTPANNQEAAFYCGENFDYFRQLFQELKDKWQRGDNEILMILSEDCAIEHIQSIARSNGIDFELVHRVKKRGEKNYIYSLHKDH